MLLYLADARRGASAENLPEQPINLRGPGVTRAWRCFGSTLARCGVAYALIGFAWEYSRSVAGYGSVVDMSFACGFALASVMFAFFLQHASRTNVEAATRWVFPVMAIGLTAAASPELVTPYTAVIVLAAGHGSFEMMIRNRIISSARCEGLHRMLAAPVGFTVQSLGVLLGVCLALFIIPASGLDQVHAALIAVLALLIAATFFYGEDAAAMRERIGDSDVGGADGSPACKAFDMSDFAVREFGLTPRECEVLAYLIEGRSRPYIRDELGISKSTVNTHVAHIYQKLGIGDRQELITMAKEWGRTAGQP